MCAGPQQLEARLVADLDPASRQQRHPSPEVGQLGSLGKVELRAGGAHLIVEVMDDGVFLLADVAVLRLDRLPELWIVDLPLLERGRREDVRAGVHRLPAQGPDAGPVQHAILLLDLLRLPPPAAGPHQLAAGDGIGGVHMPRGLYQPALVVGRYVREGSAVRDDRFQQLSRGTNPVEEAGVASFVGGTVDGAEVGLWHGAKFNWRLLIRHEHKGRRARLVPPPRARLALELPFPWQAAPRLTFQAQLFRRIPW